MQHLTVNVIQHPPVQSIKYKVQRRLRRNLIVFLGQSWLGWICNPAQGVDQRIIVPRVLPQPRIRGTTAEFKNFDNLLNVRRCPLGKGRRARELVCKILAVLNARL